jgi:hypothetical protein
MTYKLQDLLHLSRIHVHQGTLKRFIAGLILHGTFRLIPCLLHSVSFSCTGRRFSDIFNDWIEQWNLFNDWPGTVQWILFHEWREHWTDWTLFNDWTLWTVTEH